MAPGAGGVVQPTLHIPSVIQAGIDSGALFRNGGVVRYVATGRIFKLLDEIPGPDKVADEAAKRVAKVVPKIRVPLVLATVAAVGAGAGFVRKKRKDAHRLAEVNAGVSETVGKFEASLRAYVDASRDGILSEEIVSRLILDLDEVKAHTDAGNAVEFSFEQLEPLFHLVIEHTAPLARAYSVALPDIERQESASDAGVVVHLRRHLEVQKRILAETA